MLIRIITLLTINRLDGARRAPSPCLPAAGPPGREVPSFDSSASTPEVHTRRAQFTTSRRNRPALLEHRILPASWTSAAEGSDLTHLFVPCLFPVGQVDGIRCEHALRQARIGGVPPARLPPEIPTNTLRTLFQRVSTQVDCGDGTPHCTPIERSGYCGIRFAPSMRVSTTEHE
jgi:hypothetical protein